MKGLLGSLLILSGGICLCVLHCLERSHQLELLRALLQALRRAEEEIRVRRTPLPELLKGLKRETQPYFQQVFPMHNDGDKHLEGERKLPLQVFDKRCLKILEELPSAFSGDEEAVLGELKLARTRLEELRKELDETKKEEQQRFNVLAISAAVLLVILLI